MKSVFNDFESRVCANCKYYEDDMCYNNLEDSIHGFALPPKPDFGCNKFERKDK